MIYKYQWLVSGRAVSLIIKGDPVICFKGRHLADPVAGSELVVIVEEHLGDLSMRQPWPTCPHRNSCEFSDRPKRLRVNYISVCRGRASVDVTVIMMCIYLEYWRITHMIFKVYAFICAVGNGILKTKQAMQHATRNTSKLQQYS